MRVCKVCLAEKPFRGFPVQQGGRDGIRPQCKPCWRTLRRAGGRLDQRRHRDRRRTEALAKLGDRCVRCGFDDPRALQVDHVNGGGGAERSAIGPQGIYRRVMAGSTDYQLLCANCNWIKRFENGEHKPRVSD